MPAGMTDEAWIMEALLRHSVPRDFHAYRLSENVSCAIMRPWHPAFHNIGP
jgi:hypothetical protein